MGVGGKWGGGRRTFRKASSFLMDACTGNRRELANGTCMGESAKENNHLKKQFLVLKLQSMCLLTAPSSLLLN